MDLTDILFKLLSTRGRDVEDAQAAMRRSGAVLDQGVIEREVELLAGELPELDVRSRWSAIRDGAS